MELQMDFGFEIGCDFGRGSDSTCLAETYTAAALFFFFLCGGGAAIDIDVVWWLDTRRRSVTTMYVLPRSRMPTTTTTTVTFILECFALPGPLTTCIYTAVMRNTHSAYIQLGEEEEEAAERHRACMHQHHEAPKSWLWSSPVDCCFVMHGVIGFLYR
ncbi:hypothetical protein FN846DRAFT_978688 [Sphaerosporella brunnea]|uniref:Uncharacterized protein n=1 Tax=Sphaerosporella brunnea TaxID=1250544 RepID=A0A5J5ED28_9PEZI|nr:hypothetical protein FN846DRAFT_978688 [Sphaerosporella brunnea]